MCNISQMYFEQGEEKGLASGLLRGRKEGREEGRKEGREEGREEGLASGLSRGREEGREEGRQKLNETLFCLVQNGKLSAIDAAGTLKISVAEFVSLMKKAGYKAP